MVLKCALIALLMAVSAQAQEPKVLGDTRPQTPGMAGMNMGPGSASNDLIAMGGSDFDHPGLVPRANLSIGIGHMFKFLQKDPFGDELMFSYMYENAGTHGFLHTAQGEHTESLGLMKNFPLPKTRRITGYACAQAGVTSFTGSAHVQNRFDGGLSLGSIVHFERHSSIWVQESWGKVNTMPWFITTSIGYGWSW